MVEECYSKFSQDQGWAGPTCSRSVCIIRLSGQMLNEVEIEILWMHRDKRYLTL